MEYELVITWDNLTQQVFTYDSYEEAERAGDNMMENDNKILFFVLRRKD